MLGEAAAAAAKTDTFLGERYRRLVKRRGKLKALVAVARSILVIVWHLLADPTARYHDLGADFYASRIDTDRKTRTHIRQLAGTRLHRHPHPGRLTTPPTTPPEEQGGGSLLPAEPRWSVPLRWSFSDQLAAVHRVLPSALLAPQVGCGVQPVRSCRAE